MGFIRLINRIHSIEYAEMYCGLGALLWKLGKKFTEYKL